MWRVLAFMDILIAIVLVAQLFFEIPWRLIAALSGHLLVKSWLFWPEPLSVADGIIAIIALFGLIGSVDILTWGSVAVLAYKSLPAFISL